MLKMLKALSICKRFYFLGFFFSNLIGQDKKDANFSLIICLENSVIGVL